MNLNDLVDVSTALFAIAPLVFIRVPQPPRRGPADSGGSSTWRDVLAGLRYLRERDGHTTLLAMAAL